MWPSTASVALVRALHRALLLLLSCAAEPGQKLHTCSAAGRNFLRCVEGRDDSNLNITVINDSGALALLRLPYQVVGTSAPAASDTQLHMLTRRCCAQGV